MTKMFIQRIRTVCVCKRSCSFCEEGGVLTEFPSVDRIQKCRAWRGGMLAITNKSEAWSGGNFVNSVLCV